MESPTEAKQESHYIFAVIKFPGVFLVLIQMNTARVVSPKSPP